MSQEVAEKEDYWAELYRCDGNAPKMAHKIQLTKSTYTFGRDESQFIAA